MVATLFESPIQKGLREILRIVLMRQIRELRRRSKSLYFLRHGRVLPTHRELRLPDRLFRRGAGDDGYPFPERGHTHCLRRAGSAGPPRPQGRHSLRRPRGHCRQPNRLLGGLPGGTIVRLEWVERLFARHGGKAVFAARFFALSRLLEALVAGTSRMHWGTFVFYSVLGGAVWATAVGVASGFYIVYQWVTSRRSR
jgi:diadenosine tetraphosphatase ApaH/serine/threonine PP2A family protein phosphatase